MQSLSLRWQWTSGSKGCHWTLKTNVLCSIWPAPLLGPPRCQRGNHQPRSLYSHHQAPVACSCVLLYKKIYQPKTAWEALQTNNAAEKDEYISKEQAPKSSQIRCQNESPKERWLTSPDELQHEVAAPFLQCKRAPSHLQQGGNSIHLAPRLLWERSAISSLVISARLLHAWQNFPCLGSLKGP